MWQSSSCIRTHLGSGGFAERVKLIKQAYGNGVYFAAQAEVSLGTYAQPAQTFRPNADLRITRAMSLVELVNVPETFVSRDPYYVVNNTKQIKPFLLVVQVQPDAPAPANPVGAVGTSGQVQAQAQAATAAATVPPVKPSVVKSGRIFQHDPALAMQPTWFGQGLEVVCPSCLSGDSLIISYRLPSCSPIHS